MRISILGKISVTVAVSAAALVLSGCGTTVSSNVSSSASQSSAASSSGASASDSAPNFPSELIQTPPESTVTKRSLELIKPMYSASMYVSTALEQSSVFDFYTQTLTEAGFSKATDRPLADASGISFSRGAENVDVIFSPSAPSAFSVLASLSADSVS